MPTFHSGRHEYGQNFLIDTTVIDTVVDLVATTDPTPIIEIGAGGGALTMPLQRLGRPLTAIEIDSRLADNLRGRLRPTTTVVTGDFLRYRLPETAHTVVGNLPFHQTTAILRKLLHAPHWTSAVLLTQWEVARRRAGVGGATMMTAQWWPWFEFHLAGRIPAASFAPKPTVDGGLFSIRRRHEPLIATGDRRQYQAFVHTVFTGRGRGLGQILPRCGVPKAKEWLPRHGYSPQSLPRDLDAVAWAELFRLSRG